MSRIKELFSKKKSGVLNIYCTAGYPKHDSTLRLLEALEANGADLVEIGIPYSDPLADGPVIQDSSSKAISNGMTIERLFTQLDGFRKTVKLPVVLMGYINPILQYGFERFCKRMADMGIDGLILPDLPMYEYEKEYREILNRYGLDFIFLITPETSEERIKMLDNLSSGFLYAVSSSSTTGTNKNFSDKKAYFEKLGAMRLRNPVLIGFGISDKESFDQACLYANGAIIGTAFINALSGEEDEAEATRKFLNRIRGKV